MKVCAVRVVKRLKKPVHTVMIAIAGLKQLCITVKKFYCKCAKK